VRVNAPVDKLSYRQFRVRLENIRAPLDFYFMFTDTDGVSNKRHIVITPQEDREPEPGVGVEVVRKTSQGSYMVTARARIPFSGSITDDHGLEKVEFACVTTRLDVTSAAAEEFLDMLAPLYQFSGGIDQSMAAASRFLEKVRAGKGKPKEEGPAIRLVAMPGFEKTLDERRIIETSWLTRLRERLKDSRDPDLKDSAADAKKSKEEQEALNKERNKKLLLRLLREYPLEPKEDVLDLQMLLGQEPDSKDKQPRYRVQVWIDAVDTDVEMGPHKTRSKESFVFLVVSENELLVEMARDQETQHIRLEDTTEVLRKALVKMDQANLDLKVENLKLEDLPKSALPANFEQQIGKSEETTKEVKEAFDRLIEEMRVNRIQENYIAKLDTTVRQPLADILNKSFPNARDAMTKFRETLDDNSLNLAQKVEAARTTGLNARNQLEELIKQLNAVLNSMEQIKGLNELIKTLRAIEEENTRQRELMARLQKQLKLDLFKQLNLFDEEKKPDDKKPDEKK
jgi:hypothetical protein